MISNNPWFIPKSYGYGATPNTWQGWAFVLAMIASIFILATFFPDSIIFYSSLPIIVLITIVVSKAKTKGVWKWRWGHR